MGDTWTILTPNGPHELNPTFHAPKYQPGGVSGPGALRRDNRDTYQRSGDGLPTPGPLTLHGRVWRDDHNQALMVAELNAIRAAVGACTQVVRTNNAGSYTYDFLAGGATPEITPDGLGGWIVKLDLWPGRAEPTFLPVRAGAPLIAASMNTTSWGIDANRPYGWEFKVGDSDLIATHARLQHPGITGGKYVRVWRVSDFQLLATSPEITAISGAWVEVALDAPLLLEANQNYAVALQQPISSSQILRITDVEGNMAFNPAISYVRGRFSSSSATFPGTAHNNYLYGLADLLVEAP